MLTGEQVIARALCVIDGYNPDHVVNDVPYWECYTGKARIVINALIDWQK